MGVGTGVAPFDTPVMVVSVVADGGGGDAGVAGTGVAGADFLNDNQHASIGAFK